MFVGQFGLALLMILTELWTWDGSTPFLTWCLEKMIWSVRAAILRQTQRSLATRESALLTSCWNSFRDLSQITRVTTNGPSAAAPRGHDPVTAAGKFLLCFAVWFAVIGCSIVGSIITSKIVTNSLKVTSVQSFSDITGSLCVPRT